MKSISHKFLDYIPQQLEPGVIYISIEYCTATHLCLCGCGNEVVTPISPTDWNLTFDGETISLNPSIGSWDLKCQSHYWIKRNRIKWAGKWSHEKIEESWQEDSRSKREHYATQKQLRPEAQSEESEKIQDFKTEEQDNSFWIHLKNIFRKKL